MPITLFGTTGFPNPARVRAALIAKNALDKVNYVEVDVMQQQHRTPEFYAKNPLGTVPVLQTHDGHFLSESTAITEYIDGHFDGPSLTGDSALQRGQIHMMQRRAESMLMDAVGAYFHHATAGLGPELEKNQCAEWGLLQKQQAERGMRYFNDLLAEQEFVAAGHFSMADITLFYGLAFAEFAQIEVPAELTHLTNWQAAMAHKPCFSQ